MCMFTVIPAGVEVPWNGLINGTKSNRDGHGWAAARGTDLVVGKSMDPAKALADFEEALRDLGPGTISLFHSRIATAGTVDEYNVHPFYVGGDDGPKDTVMAHNGIMPSIYQPPIKDRRSDTRLFADLMNPYMHATLGVPTRRMARLIGEDIGSYNKLVFLSVRSGAPKVKIVNSHVGIQAHGVWYSNSGYMDWRPKVVTKVTTQPGWWKEDDEPGNVRVVKGGFCVACKGDDVDPYLRLCMDCETCQDCKQTFNSCRCDEVVDTRTNEEWWEDIMKAEEERVQRQQQQTQIDETGPVTLREIAGLDASPLSPSLLLPGPEKG